MMVSRLNPPTVRHDDQRAIVQPRLLERLHDARFNLALSVPRIHHVARAQGIGTNWPGDRVHQTPAGYTFA